MLILWRCIFDFNLVGNTCCFFVFHINFGFFFQVAFEHKNEKHCVLSDSRCKLVLLLFCFVPSDSVVSESRNSLQIDLFLKSDCFCPNNGRLYEKVLDDSFVGLFVFVRNVFCFCRNGQENVVEKHTFCVKVYSLKNGSKLVQLYYVAI